MLDTGYWLLVAGCWLLDSLFFIRYSLTHPLSPSLREWRGHEVGKIILNSFHVRYLLPCSMFHVYPLFPSSPLPL